MVTDSLTASSPWPSLRGWLCALLAGPALILPGTPDLVKTSVSNFTEPDNYAKSHPRRRRAVAQPRFDRDVVGVRHCRVRCGLPTIRELSGGGSNWHFRGSLF